MIYMLTTLDYMCLEDFLTGRGSVFAPQIIPVPYSTLFRARKLPRGTYVFADLERLSSADLERAAWVWRQLASQGPAVRLLNDPAHLKQRFELLRTLHQQGLNDFDVYRLDEGRAPRRFPVFVRSERQHDAMASGLIAGPQELEQFVKGWRAQGYGLSDTIVTEFCGEQDEHGLYRRYAAFKVGEHIIPVDIFFARHWEVRGMGNRLVIDEHTLAEEARFLHDNPHEDQLRRVFKLACADYGRVDYGVVGGRVQVYEINTNPYVVPGPLGGGARAELYEHFAHDFLSALHALRGPSGAPLASVEPAVQTTGRAELGRWAKQTSYQALWRSGPAQAYAERLRLTQRLRRLIQIGKRRMDEH